MRIASREQNEISKRHIQADKDTIKAQIDLRNIAQVFLGTPVRVQRGEAIYHAPDRSDSDPSLHVTAAFFIDFGNEEHKGDVFNFLQIYAQMGFKAALEFLTGDQTLPRRSWPRPECDRQLSKQPAWYAHRDQLEARTPHPKRYQHWEAHKCVNQTSVDRWGLDFAPLPTVSKTTERQLVFDRTARLTIPIYHNGELKALRGRALDSTTKPKWKTVGPKQLFNRDMLADANGGIVAICANNVDAILLMQEYPKINGLPLVAVSPTTGEAAWSEDWTADIAKAKPHAVVLFYDNDATGEKAARRRHQQHNDLGLHVAAWEWPINAPQKADLGDLLTDEIRSGKPSGVREFLAKVAVADYVFPDGLPNNLRTVLLNVHHFINQPGSKIVADHAPAAVANELIERAVREGQITPEMELTIDQLLVIFQAMGHDVKRRSLATGISQLMAMGRFLQNYDPSTKANDSIGAKFCKNSKRGRPALAFRLAPKDDFLQVFQRKLLYWLRLALYAHAGFVPPDVWLEDETVYEQVRAVSRQLRDERPNAYEAVNQEYREQAQQITALLSDLGESTPLVCEEPFNNGPSYRRAFYAGVVANAPTKLMVVEDDLVEQPARQISRKDAAFEIGVTPAALTKIRQDCNVVTEERHVKVKVKHTYDVAGFIDRCFPALKDRNSAGAWLESGDGSRMRLMYATDAQKDQFVRMHRAMGHDVTLKVQVPSIERPATADERQTIEIVRRRRKARHVRASVLPSDAKPHKRQPRLQPAETLNNLQEWIVHLLKGMLNMQREGAYTMA